MNRREQVRWNGGKDENGKTVLGSERKGQAHSLLMTHNLDQMTILTVTNGWILSR